MKLQLTLDAINRAMARTEMYSCVILKANTDPVIWDKARQQLIKMGVLVNGTGYQNYLTSEEQLFEDAETIRALLSERRSMWLAWLWTCVQEGIEVE